MLRDVALGSWEFSASFCVGRSRGCEVSIVTSEDTRTVSKRHVGFMPLTETFTTTAGYGKRRWLVHDLETMNGTAVNGEEIPAGGNRELRGGDEVVLASAMRQCVRLQVQFSDEARSRIVVKALACSTAPSPAPLHRRLVTPGTLARRSPRRNVVTTASVAATGLDRSMATIAGSPAVMRTGCRSGRVAGTLGSDANATTPLPQSVSQKRSRASPRHVVGEVKNVERNDKQQNTPQSQQRKRSRRGGINEEGDEAVARGGAATEEEVVSAAKKAREHEEEKERLMMCSVCLEYFHGSATLPCSHTFCGYCISNWFRHSLSCPECRNVVKTVPVRNRALDELVERLVGHTEAYKSHVRRRARMQRRLVESRQYTCGSSDDNGDVSEGAVRGVGCLQLGRTSTVESSRAHTSVFTRWSVDKRLVFSAYISNQFGETRLATCKKVGLTQLALDASSMNELITVAQNLLLDCVGLRMTSNECRQRLKIFVLFG
ncbi:unnamed protein product [Hyaloperonospora brassicae]|uniref:E3 ubiquitin-protein ligase CHFR n=1 Tax=Hyaloperonospora brassicae TaxID=162125 RepID=A0AAV0U4R3_HYABA|nr:unnamed protein product [Hyaloperonospora brassicae]